MLDPDQCSDMSILREQIDALDRALIEMLATRASYIDRAVVLKQDVGLPASIPTRIEDVIAKVRMAAGTQNLDADLAETLWRQLLDWSIAREAQTIDFA